jgi:hypothetical protein
MQPGHWLIASVYCPLIVWKWSRGDAERPSAAMRFAEPSKQCLNAFWRTIMRNNLIPAVALAVIGFTVPAAAADVGYVQRPLTEIYTRVGPLPVQAAIDIANGVGLVSVSSTDKWFNEWQIEGRDVTGSYMEVDVDARTGAIVNVDR